MFNIDILRIESVNYPSVGMPACLVRRFVHGIETPIEGEQPATRVRTPGVGNKLYFMGDDRTLAAIADWPNYAIAALAARHGCSLIADGDDFFCLPMKDGGRAIDLLDSPDRSLFAYLFADGRIDVVSAQNLARDRYTQPSGRMEGAFEVKLLERRRAPESMIRAMQSFDVFDASAALRQLFWKEFVPSLDDPLVLPQRIFLCGSEDSRPYAQVAGKVAFARSCALDLAKALRAAACLNLRRVDRTHWTFDLLPWPGIVTMRGTDGRIAVVRNGLFTEAYFDVVDLLLTIMRPRAIELTCEAGARRLSEALPTPAPLHVAIPENLLDPSAHEVIAQVAALEQVLTKLGISRGRAAEIIDEL